MQFLIVCNNTHFKDVSDEKTDEKVHGDTSPQWPTLTGPTPPHLVGSVTCN